jgi:hypothetical protein
MPSKHKSKGLDFKEKNTRKEEERKRKEKGRRKKKRKRKEKRKGKEKGRRKKKRKRKKRKEEEEKGEEEWRRRRKMEKKNREGGEETLEYSLPSWGIDSRTPHTQSHIHGCSRPLCHWCGFLHITYAPFPMDFKSSLHYLQCIIQCKALKIVVMLCYLRNNNKN